MADNEDQSALQPPDYPVSPPPTFAQATQATSAFIHPAVIHKSPLDRSFSVPCKSQSNDRTCPPNPANVQLTVDEMEETCDFPNRHVPSIDEAVTPPVTPSRPTLGSIFKGRRLPSLKLKRNRMGSIRSHKGSEPPSPVTSTHGPTITVTGGSDEEATSMISDYLSPDKFNYKREAKCHFIGDDVSLYGTPKEEYSPVNLGKETVNKSSASSFLKDQIISFFQPSDNKLAMKLFGNKNALLKEKMRQKAAGNWVIHPCSNFRLDCFADDLVTIGDI
ncbi:unnamed protein product [Dimorphilus gyrociliatus]|uniref:Ion transport N-terminal domain-containing protein n=1 Tax=Dimorphilus gyrociliatus TaxID=2664684 RepID=A0A7I8WCF5_9ANNE|nr:unnamed protein product [Dimorphilus gyrociliatus]